MELAQPLTVLVIGAAVGLLTGMVGVGGGFITVPALHILAGIPLHLAVGSAACQTLGPLTTGILHRRGARTLQIRLALTMLGGTLTGLFLGLRFLEWAKAPEATLPVGGRGVPRIDLVLLSCYLGLLLFLAVIIALEWLLTRGRPPRPRRGLLDALKLPPLGRYPEVDGRPLSLPVVVVLAIGVGFLSGGLGMGGAIVLVPALVYLIGVPTHRAVSVSLVLFWFTTIGAAGGHALHDNVDLVLVCMLLVGGTAGAKVGSIIAERMSGRRLRFILAMMILVSAVLISVRLWRLLGG